MGLEELDLLEAFSQAATLAELRRYAEPVNRNETAGSRAGEELDNVATARELVLDEDGVLRPCQLRDLRGKDVVGAPPGRRGAAGESKQVEQEGDHGAEILSGSAPTDQRLAGRRGLGEGQVAFDSHGAARYRGSTFQT